MRILIDLIVHVSASGSRAAGSGRTGEAGGRTSGETGQRRTGKTGTEKGQYRLDFACFYKFNLSFSAVFKTCTGWYEMVKVNV